MRLGLPQSKVGTTLPWGENTRYVAVNLPITRNNVAFEAGGVPPITAQIGPWEVRSSQRSASSA